ncbi:MAG: GDP-mannose 4,6-dehydratase [Candidatus Doudnabacteria bacterium]|nr:GDP-mannose 4,6-dehydratase [Candidatus Doudnabacteria bacterium]
MSKIIVTGANGFVGNHLVKELSAAGYDVIGVGGPVLPGMKEPEGLYKYIVADLSKPEEVANIDFQDVEGVIHLAGMAAVGPSFDQPLLYVATNVGLEVNLFEEATKQGVKPKFIVVSSGSLYDSNADLPITEQSPVLSNSPYAVSKIGQEEMGKYYTTRGFEVVIARPFNHIGPGQNLGFLVPDLTKQVIDVERGAANKVMVGNLEAKRDYTDVRDIARAYRLLLEKGRSGETYNICSGQSHSGQEMLDLILAKAASQVTVEQDPARMRPSDTPDIYGSHDKISAHTGWQPELSLDTTIADVVSDWRSR